MSGKTYTPIDHIREVYVKYYNASGFGEVCGISGAKSFDSLMKQMNKEGLSPYEQLTHLVSTLLDGLKYDNW